MKKLNVMWRPETTINGASPKSLMSRENEYNTERKEYEY
jgi:hypothetical protein